MKIFIHYAKMTLRKRNNDELDKAKNIDSLLVFGYQSKVFRDDEKAMFIDRGQHLIPWMGDNSVMIDRSVVTKGSLGV